MKAIEVINEYKVDNVAGLGAIPNNQEVDYLGKRVYMKPSVFLKLAAPLANPPSAGAIVQHLKQGGSLGPPYLEISIPETWDDKDFSEYAKVVSHDGRNRMLAIQEVEGDDPVEVHLFFRHGYRARHLTPDFMKYLQKALITQQGNAVIFNPFTLSISSSNPDTLREPV